MARTLLVSRVTVPPAHEPEYLRVRGELARLSQARGLEARLRQLATYAPDAWELWEEVSL